VKLPYYFRHIARRPRRCQKMVMIGKDNPGFDFPTIVVVPLLNTFQQLAFARFVVEDVSLVQSGACHKIDGIINKQMGWVVCVLLELHVFFREY